jgi:non-canonical (house-cleaning) NTP pyrophosphatase
MIINIGSKNSVKINAVQESLKLYPVLFANPDIKGIDIEVEQFGHPKDLRSTIKGAIKRAKRAFQDWDYSFGLEGGLTKVPFSPLTRSKNNIFRANEN